MSTRHASEGKLEKDEIKVSTDYLIVSDGIVVLTVAREFHKSYPIASIALLEKNADLGNHASGRNSSVWHSGTYNDSNTLKAKVYAEGT